MKINFYIGFYYMQKEHFVPRLYNYIGNDVLNSLLSSKFKRTINSKLKAINFDCISLKNHVFKITNINKILNENEEIYFDIYLKDIGIEVCYSQHSDDNMFYIDNLDEISKKVKQWEQILLELKFEPFREMVEQNFV